MLFEQRYQKLNSRQKQAVDQIDGPVMVVAGPGSGKTEILSIRVANILKKSDTLPENILCLTFTDAASKNMRDRLFQLIGIEAFRVNIHTFHSFASDISRKFPEEFYDFTQMELADDIIIMDIISSILKDLPLSNAFTVKDPKNNFVYLGSIKKKIDALKKAGVTAEEYKKILQFNKPIYEEINKLLTPFFNVSISKKIIPEVPKLLKSLHNLPTNNFKLVHLNLINYKELIVRSLETAYNDAIENNKTRPITEWKRKWMKQGAHTKEWRLKDSYQLDLNFELAKVYEEYQKKMKKNHYIDFNDIILDLIRVLETNAGVLASLQEQYQYILVDEFQDTNESQMRIINLLIDNPVNENKPNIMVVGDDDQTIYKFQGAELNNILQFKERYPETKFITLLKNYRSTMGIVELSKRVISQGKERLENKIDEINKDTKSANTNLSEGCIHVYSFDTALHEYKYIADKIKNKLDNNVNADTIAIIARKHDKLKEIAKFLQNANIPIRYEKQRNVLEYPHIQELLTMAKLIQSITDKCLDYENYLMPKFLSFPFWNLETKVIWQLAIDANKTKKNEQQGRWLDIMLKSDNHQLCDIAKWLIDTANKGETYSLESMIDILIGPLESKANEFTSKFRQYYFNKQNYKNNPQEYLERLSSLNSLLQFVYEYDRKELSVGLKKLIEYVELYKDHNLPITDNSPYLSGLKAVTLLTAHKAKGLEFETVFVINCQSDIWDSNKSHDIISFPRNFAIEPKPDNFDDHLRLFFVALSRAEKNLYLTYFNKKSKKSNKSNKISFLAKEIFDKFNFDIKIDYKNFDIGDTICALETNTFTPIIQNNFDEKSILKPLVENYVMSVTHLNNFLNVVDGGPHMFLEKNLLYFPESQKTFMKYGSAMHAVMEDIYHYVRVNKVTPKIKDVRLFFQHRLEKVNLDKHDFKKYLEKGLAVWDVYMQRRSGYIDGNHKIETDFKTQQVVVGDVMVNGKIDKMVFDDKNKIIDVYDFKTGKYKLTWNDRNQNQLQGYKRQLIFYKILVENSRDFSKFKVNNGYLEFLYPTKDNNIFILGYDITNDDVERLKNIIKVVGKKIKNLDFPDVSKYKKNYKGIIDFENDLINGLI